jgi:hypothetical protein
MVKLHWLIAALLLVTLFGCNAAVSVGGRTIGVQEGKLVLTDGFVETVFPHSFERTWAATEKALKDLKMEVKEKRQRIARGNFQGVYREEHINIEVSYVGKEETRVAVRVGLMGNMAVSQLILERVVQSF